MSTTAQMNLPPPVAFNVERLAPSYGDIAREPIAGR